jgi:DNA ligase-1
MKIIDILNEVAATSKGSEKEAILAKHKDNSVLQEVFFYTYSSYHTFGVKKYNEPKSTGSMTIEDCFGKAKVLLDMLAKREVTGGAAQDAIAIVLSCYEKDSQDVICRILDRDLKCGATDTIMNRLVPNLVPSFDVALAHKFDDKSEKVVTFDGNWFCSRKIDGCRCPVIIQGKNRTAYSRQGKEFTTIDLVKEELAELIATLGEDSMAFDGEIGLVDKNGNEDFQGIMKEIKKKDHTIKNPMYQIFDMMTVDEFFGKTKSPLFATRLAKVRNAMEGKKFKYISLLEQVPLTEESFAAMQKKADEGKWEGLMLRKNTVYESGRSKNLLKVKKFHDAEYVVEDVEFGPMNFTEKGIGSQEITCLRCVKIRHKGCVVSVGSGFSKDQRIEFMADPKKILGKTITVKYFEETTNQNGGFSLRFPVIKVVHGDSREV